MDAKAPIISDRYEDLHPEEENITLAKELLNKRDALRSKLHGNADIHRNKGFFGDLYEAVVAEFITKQIKNPGLKVIKGIIRKDGLTESPKVDIFVYRVEDDLYSFYPQRGIGIVESSQVVLVVEVKGYFDTRSLPASIEQLKSIKNHCNDDVKSCAWAFDISMRSKENTFADEFKKNNISNFVVICKDTKKQKVWDCDSGLKAFINTLRTLE